MPEKYMIIINIGIFVVITALIFLLVHVNHVIFRKIHEKKPGLHLLFFERIMGLVIIIGGIILAFSVFGGIGSVWKTLLGGTAIVSAVTVFAAQDVIKDILAGLMISIYKPFEIGNRVELEDGTAGVITDITMRHVVLRVIDTQMLVIPNSKLNSITIKNFSYHAETRSILFKFFIAYQSDVEKAMNVIGQAVKESEYSLPEVETENGPEYSPVYFIAYEDSSLRLETTVYFDSTVRSEVVKSDINLRVNRALKDNDIEIPYTYINVVQK